MKNVFAFIKRNPALSAAIAFGLIVVIYIVYKSNPGNSVNSSLGYTAQPAELFYGDHSHDTPPTQGSGGLTSGPTGTPVAVPAGKAVSVTVAGQFASTPGGTNNKGVNIASLIPGNVLTLLSTTPSKFNGVNYYNVYYNGKTGYVRGSTIGYA